MTIADRILDLLADAPDGMKRRELVSALEDLTPGTVDATLHDMGKAGRIKRDPITSLWQVSDEPVRAAVKPERAAIVTTGTESNYVVLPDGPAIVTPNAAGFIPASPVVTGSLREPVREHAQKAEHVATVTIGGMVITISGTSPYLAHRGLAAALQAMQ